MLNHRTDKTEYGLKDKHFSVNNQKKQRNSTQGWNLEALYQDRTTSWLLLEDLQKANPVKVTEHESTRNIEKIAFNW